MNENSSEKEIWREAMRSGRKIFRDTRNRVLGGVLSGIAEYYGWNCSLLRLLFILLSVFLSSVSVWIAIFAYLIMWMVIPAPATIIDKVRMRKIELQSASEEYIEEAWRKNYEAVLSEENNYVPDGCATRFFRVLIYIGLALCAMPVILALLLFFLFFIGAVQLYGIPMLYLFAAGLVLFLSICFIVYKILRYSGVCKAMNRRLGLILVLVWCALLIVVSQKLYGVYERYGGWDGFKNEYFSEEAFSRFFHGNFASQMSTYSGSYYSDGVGDTGGSFTRALWNDDLRELPFVVETAMFENDSTVSISFFDCSQWNYYRMPEDADASVLLHLNGDLHDVPLTCVWDSVENLITIVPDNPESITAAYVESTHFGVSYSDDVSVLHCGGVSFSIFFSEGKFPELVLHAGDSCRVRHLHPESSVKISRNNGDCIKQ